MKDTERLLGIAREQKKALQEGDILTACALAEERNRILEKHGMREKSSGGELQKGKDRKSRGTDKERIHNPGREDGDRLGDGLLEEICLLDEEIVEIITLHMHMIKQQIFDIHRARSRMCEPSRIPGYRKPEKVSLSI